MLHQIIRGNRILKSKVVHKNNADHKESGKCSPASQDRTIFAVNKESKQTYSKITEQIES